MEEVVDRIETWMRAKGLSGPELAKELGMNRSTVIHIMNRRNKPSLQFIMLLATFDTEIDLRHLLTGKSSSTPPQEIAEEKRSVETKVIEKIKEVRTGKDTMIVLLPDGTYKSFVEQQ